MFRIKRIYEVQTIEDKKAITQVKKLIRAEYPNRSSEEIEQLTDNIFNNGINSFRPMLFVAEGFASKIKGFALVFHDPDLKFSFLEELLVTRENENLGIGEALYQRVKEEMQRRKS